MHNKFTISALALVLSLSVYSQQAKKTVESLFQENVIEFYPNPATTHLNVDIVHSSLKKVEFKVHSIIGNKMKISVQDMGNGKYKIPVEGFATGYYFLIITEEESRFKKAYRFSKD